MILHTKRDDPAPSRMGVSLGMFEGEEKRLGYTMLKKAKLTLGRLQEGNRAVLKPAISAPSSFLLRKGAESNNYVKVCLNIFSFPFGKERCFFFIANKGGLRTFG